jgi:hypothetical protein
MPTWFQRISDAVYREYDRRIRRASLVTEYGAPHHDAASAPRASAESEDAAVITNLPPGVELPDTGDDGATVAHVPPGTHLVDGRE